MSKFQQKFDIIVQGPISNKNLKKFYCSIDFDIVEKIIYSDCNNSIEFSAKNLHVATHIDPGKNEGDFSKPLNIDRYLAGVSSSLSLVESEYVLIVRSDVTFSFDMLLDKLDLQKLDDSIRWFDTGNAEALLNASLSVQEYEKDHQLKLGAYEIAAYEKNFIDTNQLEKIADNFNKSDYGQAIKKYLNR